VPVLGTGASFSADEGAAIIQAHRLSTDRGWVVEHPLPEADPTEVNYPLELSTRGARGTASFAKHPLYALLLAGADRVGGVTAMVLLSVAGTVTAAALAAALAARMGAAASFGHGAGLARPALWVVGLASPLTFDGYLVIAHTLGAAAAAGAVLFAVRALEDHRALASVAGVAVCIALAVLVRNEAVLFALGLGVASGAVAVARRHRAAAGVAMASVLAAAGAHLGEQEWIRRILGGSVVGLPGGPGATSGFLAGRLKSFTLTWLRPGYGGRPLVEAALLLMLCALAVGVVAARRHPGDRRPVVALAAGAAGAALLALAVEPTNLVPGLLVAFPVAAAGLVAVGARRREALAGLAARVAFGTFAVFAAAVVATQYVTGGSGEWGGRYFALGLPVLAPVLLLALASLGRALPPSARTAAAAALVTCAVALTVMGLAGLRDIHRFTARLQETAAQAGRELGPRPVMVATHAAIPRLAWATFDDQRWLLARPGGLDSLVRRLHGAGVDRLVLVTDQRERDTTELGSGVHVVSRRTPSGGPNWDVLILRIGP
ncbi:MAG TPA: hypothetical protein VG455_14175, partial [Acidimicrobiales bacterium]|nr:hypothetical protein [Acidimicrobiales bacterium]